jgi:hypothetical protein
VIYTAEQRQDALNAEKAHADGRYCDVRCRETKWLCDVWNAHYPVIRELQAARRAVHSVRQAGSVWA